MKDFTKTSFSPIKILLLVLVNVIYGLFVLSAILDLIQLSRPNFEISKLFCGSDYLKKDIESTINASRTYFTGETQYKLISSVINLIIFNLVIFRDSLVRFWILLRNTFSKGSQHWSNLVYCLVLITFYMFFVSPLLCLHYSYNNFQSYQKTLLILLEIVLLIVMCLKKNRKRIVKIGLLIICIVQCVLALYNFFGNSGIHISNVQPYKDTGELGKLIEKCSKKCGYSKDFVMYFTGKEKNSLDPNTILISGTKANPHLLLVNADDSHQNIPICFKDVAHLFATTFYRQDLYILCFELALYVLATAILIGLFSSRKFVSAFGYNKEEHPLIVRYFICVFAFYHVLQLLSWALIPIEVFLQFRIDDFILEMLGKKVFSVAMCDSLVKNYNFVFMSDLYRCLNYGKITHMTRFSRLLAKK